MSDIAREATKVALLRARLLDLYPELGDDGVALTDTLEGMTNFNEMVCILVDSAENDAALVTALKDRIESMNLRMTRLAEREDKKRNTVAGAMEAAGVRKIEAPEFTISLRALQKKVVVTDEEKIPADYWREKTTKSVDKTALKSALENGPVAGAELSNGGFGLSVRSR